LTLAVTVGLVAGFAARTVLEPVPVPVSVPATQASVVPTPVSTEDVMPTQPAAKDQDPAQQRQQSEAALTAALERYDARRYVDLALTVVDRNTGRTFSYNGEWLFETASIVKVEILATLLLEAQHSRRPLTASEQSLATTMIEYSDNVAASALWDRTGGISLSTDAFGLTGTRPGANGRWAGATTTAEDQARLITTLASPGCPIDDSGYVFGLMRNVDDSQAWGISAAARPGETVALKNGWMPRPNDHSHWAVNSIGRITGADTDVTVVVLSRGHTSLKAGVELVEAVTKTARGYLGW
jgi:beta-lactamase class A